MVAFDNKAYMREYSKMDREAARKAGLCIVCRREKAREGRSTCERCTERKREYQSLRSKDPEYIAKHNKYKRERYHRYISNGLCGYCGKPIYKGNVCEHHYILKKRGLEKQKQKRHEARQAVEYETGRTLCQKCNNPAIEGKRLCQHHYDIVMKYSIPKAHAATRRILADALRTHKPIKWAIFKEIVLRKKG